MFCTVLNWYLPLWKRRNLCREATIAFQVLDKVEDEVRLQLSDLISKSGQLFAGRPKRKNRHLMVQRS